MKTPIFILRCYFFLHAILNLVVALSCAIGVFESIMGNRPGFLVFFLVLGQVQLWLALSGARIGFCLQSMVAQPDPILQWAKWQERTLHFFNIFMCGLPTLDIFAIRGVLGDIRVRQAQAQTV